MCAVCGVLVMALPIPIVVDNFADYYSEQKKIEAKELKKEAKAKEAEIALMAEGVANQAGYTNIDSLCVHICMYSPVPCPPSLHNRSLRISL